MFRSQGEATSPFLGLLTQWLSQSMFVLLHQAVYSQQAWPASGWSLLMAVTVKAKLWPPPGLSLGEEMHFTHLHWCPNPSGGPTRELLLACSLLQQSDILCKDSQPFRRRFLQDKESHFPSNIADYGFPVLRIFFLLPGKGKVTFIKLVFCSSLCRFGFYKYMKMDRPEKSLDSGEKPEHPGRAPNVRTQRILLSVTFLCGLAAPAEGSC